MFIHNCPEFCREHSDESDKFAEGSLSSPNQFQHIYIITWRKIIWCLSCVRYIFSFQSSHQCWDIFLLFSSFFDAFELWCWKGLRSPLDCKEIKPVNLKGNQSWIFTGRTDAEAEAPIHWPLDAKNWLIGKDPNAGNDWGQEEKGTTEDEVVGWHHRLTGTWVWGSSGSWWWTGRPGVLQSMGSQSVRHDWATELNWWQRIGLYATWGWIPLASLPLQVFTILEPGGLLSTGSHRVGHDWSDLAAAAAVKS